MIEEFEKYVKELPEELQKKARQCKTVEELNKFVAENRIELPNEALEMVSGGCGSSSRKCKYCGSTNIKSNYEGKAYCGDCGRLLDSNSMTLSR